MTQKDTEQRIRERAFQIWLEEGQPEGRDKRHWERAEKELSGTPHNEGAPLVPDPIGEIKFAASRTLDRGPEPQNQRRQSQDYPERDRD